MSVPGLVSRSRRLATLALVAVAALASVDARAATITAADLPSGVDSVPLGFAQAFSQGGVFTRKFVAGYEVAGVLEGFENGEIDGDNQLIGIFFETPQVVTELVLGLLFALGEEDDVLNEFAGVLVRAPAFGQAGYVLSVLDGTTASFESQFESRPVTNVSPGTFGNAGVWSIANPFGDVAVTQVILFGFAFGDTGPPDYRGSDYGFVSLTTVPEPGTLALLGLGFAGLGVRRRAQLR